jgi:hypothetical protein
LGFGIWATYNVGWYALPNSATSDESDKELTTAELFGGTILLTWSESRDDEVLLYADEHKLNSEPLDRFVKRKGGVNACAARFSRGRGPRCGK